MKNTLRNPFVIAMICIVFSLLYGCSYNKGSGNIAVSGSVNTTSSISNNSPFDPHIDQLGFVKTMGIFPSMVSTDNGYYFEGGSWPNKFLYYTDKSSMKTIPLCNKPDCLHVEEINPGKKEKCNAYLGGDNAIQTGDLLYYDSYLYFFRTISEVPNPDKYVLTQLSIDGTQRRDIHVFKIIPKYMIIHCGFLYYSTVESDNIGKTESTLSKSAIYRIPMNDLSKPPELLYEKEGIYASIVRLMGYNDSVYFQIFSYSDASMQKLNSNLIRYNIESGSTSTISENTRRYAICKNMIVFSSDDEHKCMCNLNGSNKQVLEGIIGDANCDDRYLITDTITMYREGLKDKQGNPIKMHLYIYDLNGHELLSFNLEKFGKVSIMGCDNSNLFLATTNFKSKNERVNEFWRIDKNKIADGSAQMELFFSYTLKTNAQ